MPRVKGGPVHARKRKRVLRAAQGFRGGPGTLYRVAKEFVARAGVYSFRDRRQNKRNYRSLWITRLGGALRARGISYNRFIPALVAAGIQLNRKMLSELAVGDVVAFDAIVEQVRPFIKQPAPKAKTA